MLDLWDAVCYSNNYLSDERFLFARIFCPEGCLKVSYREANVRTEKRG